MVDMMRCITTQLVEHPDRVRLEEEERDNTIVVKLRVAEQDLGKVIGRKGRTAQALRVLLTAAAARTGKRAILEIVE